MTVALEKETEVFLTASSLWMLPLLLLQLILELFGQHLSKLKTMRRSRPMPKDWQSFYPKLREAEWPIHVLLAEGARQLLSGQPFDLRSITFDPDPPETFQPPMPRSAMAMHQRMEELARFNADPERYVRRHAQRIARSESESGEFRAGEFSESGAGQGIRLPTWPGD